MPLDKMEQAQIIAFAVSLLLVIGLYIAYEVGVRRDLRALLSSRSRVRAAEFGPRYYSDPAEAEVATFVVSKFQELTGVDLTGVRPSDEIVRDLKLDELDSLATVEIINEIEEKFGVGITDSEAAATRTIHDLIELISSKRQTTPLVV